MVKMIKIDHEMQVIVENIVALFWRHDVVLMSQIHNYYFCMCINHSLNALSLTCNKGDTAAQKSDKILQCSYQKIHSTPSSNK